MSNLPPLPETMAALLWEHLQFDVRNRTDAQLEAFCAALRSYAEEAVRLEREACAKLCDEEAAQNARMQLGDDYEEAANLCAAAIRARSQEGQG